MSGATRPLPPTAPALPDHPARRPGSRRSRQGPSPAAGPIAPPHPPRRRKGLSKRRSPEQRPKWPAQSLRGWKQHVAQAPNRRLGRRRPAPYPLGPSDSETPGPGLRLMSRRHLQVLADAIAAAPAGSVGFQQRLRHGHEDLRRQLQPKRPESVCRRHLQSNPVDLTAPLPAQAPPQGIVAPLQPDVKFCIA